MKAKCPKCKHEWNYKGKSKHYVTCPECYRKINIKKLKEQTQSNIFPKEKYLKGGSNRK